MDTLTTKMRGLWADHAFYTELVVISALNNLPSLNTYLNRLLTNQDEIGNQYGVFFGGRAASTVSRLLRVHINTAVDLVNAAKAGDSARVSDAMLRAEQNNTDIAGALFSINPAFDFSRTYQFMDTHIKLLTQAVTFAIMKNFEAEVNTLDTNTEHLMNFSDYQSDIISAIFRFS